MGFKLGAGSGLGTCERLGEGSGEVEGSGHLHLVGVSEAKGDGLVAHGTLRNGVARIGRVILVVTW